MDHRRQHQHCVQLACPPGDSPATKPMMRHPKDDAAHLFISMCPSLYRAVYRGRTEEVMELLLRQKGAARDGKAAAGIRHGQCDILEVSAESNTVLHVAAEQGHDKLIQELYHRFTEHGLLLSHRNSALDTPLHCAARAGHVMAVAVLVKLSRGSGESILGCRNQAGDTALHLAARHGHHVVVAALVSAAAGPAADLNNAGVSPLYLAVMSGSVQAVKAITKCKDASSAGPSSQNALHAAVFQSSEMVDVLLGWRPALADQVDSSGSSPLHFASSAGDRSVVHAILRAAPPSTVYKKDSSGLSALHVAARMGHHRVAKEMLRMYPDAGELRDGDGGTFLHTACREKQASVVSSVAIKSRRLRGLLLDARDGGGNTALHLAVAAGAPGVVEDLLRKGGARADVVNDDGDTPFDLLAAASTTSSFTMVRLVVTLVAYGAQLGSTRRQDQLAPWSGRDVVQGVERTSDSLAVVAVLIAASAFAAGFNVPGGYDSGGTGRALLEGKSPAFGTFLFLDMFAVATSVVAVILLVYGKTSRSAVASFTSFAWALQCMWVSLMTLMLAFYVALAITSAVSRYGLMAIETCIFALQMCVTTWIMPAKSWSTIWRFIVRQRISHDKGKNVIIKRQYPLAGAFVLHFCLFTVITNIAGLIFWVTTDGRQGTGTPVVLSPTPSPVV
ncbi:hypothetical protein SORBI_3005G063800 [Sorghum bicolor]|uniref:PGG domain-containing protein n=2 Tax=Sorghum bicolor TaxID=4558 RepID=A0A1Z5RH24_SORBI|nr:hypothetical protein SORBI_3005G063800 [Sorghum bicolor]